MMLVDAMLIAAALLPWRWGMAILFLPGAGALAAGALSRRWGTPFTRVVVILAFACAALVGALIMFHRLTLARMQPLIFVGQLALGVLLAFRIFSVWRGRGKALVPGGRLVAWTQLVVLAWLVLAGHGCSADRMILGENHQAIPAPDAQRQQVIVDGRVVECWVARSPAPGPAQASVIYFIGKGGRADQWVSAVAWSWKQRPVELWAMNYPGSGGSAGPARLDQVAPDALALYDAVHRAHPERPIFVQGGSFGTAVALCVAARRPVAGLVLQNPPPLRQLILGYYGW